ncbi:MAG: glycosyltransferase family 2 protein [Ilumatobacteraceae bacterium]
MIAVVVLTYRPPVDLLHDCIASVARSASADAIVVVDNGGDAGVEQVEAAAAGRVSVLRPGENLGFAGGMNLGMRHAIDLGATSVALLNDDTVVAPGWLATLAARLGDGDDIGAVQPKLLFPGPAPQRINSVGVRWRADGAGIDIGCDEIDRGQYDHVRPIELFTGGAVLLRRELIETTGGFDDRYFLYYEDIDLGLRGRELGWRYLCEPASVVWHRRGATTTTRPAQSRYWQERNRLWCLARHAPASSVARGLLLSTARLARHPSRAQLRAVVRGIGGIPRRRREHRHPPTALVTAPP